MRAKVIAGVALISATGLILAGCAGGPSAGGDQGGDEKVTLTWLQWWANEKGQETLDRIKDTFEAEHPNITLEIQDVPAAQAHDKITTLALGGQAPDLIAMQAAWQTEFALSGIIEPLDSYIAQEDPAFLEELEGPMLASFQDEIWGVPLNFSPTAMFYNEDIIEAAGVDVPTNWDEFREASEAIAVDAGKFAVTANLAVEPATPISYEIFPFILSAGGEILDDDNLAAFASPEGVEALEYVKDLWDVEGVATPGAAGTTEAQKRENFVAGNTAFMFDGPAGVSISRSNEALNFGVAPMPAGSVDASYVGGSLLGMTADSKNKDAAWEFMSWLGSEEGSALWAEAMSVFPANAAAMAASVVTDDADLSVFAEITSNSDVLQAVDPRLVNSQELRKVFTNEMQAFFAGSKSAEQALQDAQDAWNEEISAAIG